MAGVTARALPSVLLACLLLVGCGDRPVEAPPAGGDAGVLHPPPALIEVPIGDPEEGVTVGVSQHQIDEARAIGVPVGFVGPLGHVFVYIPKGTFLMGSPEDEAGRDPSEVQHKVHIDRGFYMQQRPVAHAGSTHGKDPEATHFSWGSVWRVVGTYLEADEVHEYRLPTEAEWEYACRAGTQTRWWWGERMPAPGEQAAYRVNPWGLVDMGAQLEWTGDRYADHPSWEVSDPTGAEHGEARVLKGIHPADVRSDKDGGAYLSLDADPTLLGGRPAQRRASQPVSDGATPFGYAKVRLVAPVGYGLGHYGSVQVTFRLVDEDGKDAPNQDYDLRIIAMNDRLAARVKNEDAVWVRITKPELPLTISMVPGSYYVYAEGKRDGSLVRGIEQKFHATPGTLEQPVPVPPADVSRFGSGVRSEPK